MRLRPLMLLRYFFSFPIIFSIFCLFLSSNIGASENESISNNENSAIIDLEAVAEICKSSPELRKKGVGEHYFNFKNFPTNVDIYVYTARIAQNIPGAYSKAGKISFDDNNRLTINGKVKASIYGLNDLNYLPGERIHYFFEKADKTFIAEASYIAKPLVAQSAQGTFSFEAELIGLVPANYLLTLRGIPESERIQLISMTGEQKLKHVLTYSCEVPITIMPGIVGQENGESIIRFNRKSGDKASLTLFSGHHLPSKLSKKDK